MIDNGLNKESTKENLNPPPKVGGSKKEELSTYQRYRTLICVNIGFDALKEKYENSDFGQIDEILDILVETIASKKDKIRVSGEEMPASIVKSQLLKLNQGHIEYVLESMSKNTTKAKNIKAYLLTSLYNAPKTINTYYNNLIQHDLYGNSPLRRS